MYTKNKMITASCLFFAFSALTGLRQAQAQVVLSSNDWKTHVVSSIRGQKIEWTLNNDYGATVWVAQNTSSNNLGRSIYLFIDGRDFTQKRLKNIFLGFAKKYREPYHLIIRAFSDRAIIQKHLEEQDSPLVYKKGRGLDHGEYYAAYYSRIDGEEKMVYTPSPHKKRQITVLIRKKVISYSGNIDQDLLLAIEEGDIDHARDFLTKGADVHTVNDSGDNALMRAALNGHTDLAIDLLRRTHDVDHKNKEGWTALMVAAAEGENVIVRALLERGSNINARNLDGYSPLMLAASRGQEDVVKLLLLKGADINVRNSRGSTILSLVDNSLSGTVHDDMLSLLKKAGAKE